MFAAWRDATHTAALLFSTAADLAILDPHWYLKSRRSFHGCYESLDLANEVPEAQALAKYFNHSRKSPRLFCTFRRVSYDRPLFVTTKSGASVFDWTAVEYRYAIRMMMPRDQKRGISFDPATEKFILHYFYFTGHDSHLQLQASLLKILQQQYTFKVEGLQEHGCMPSYVSASTPNTIIQCTQSQKPPDGWMLNECYAFTMLQSGFRLQWLNILREIKAKNLDLNRKEVVYLFQRTCWQTGCEGETDTYLPEAHKILLGVDFCNQLLDALENSFTAIKGNWLQRMSMQVLITLGARVLCLAQNHQIKARAAHFLRGCRAVCMDWLLGTSQYRCKDSETLALIAATCRQTFDVDLDALFAVFSSEQDLGDFIECATYLDTYPLRRESNYSSDCIILAGRDARFAHSMESHLRRLVTTHNDWFHSAISRILPCYAPGGWWEVLPAPNDRWIKTKSGGNEPMDIYYNLLNRTCVINGNTRTSLPEEYTQHWLYEHFIVFVSSNYKCSTRSCRYWYLTFTLIQGPPFGGQDGHAWHEISNHCACTCGCIWFGPSHGNISIPDILCPADYGHSYTLACVLGIWSSEPNGILLSTRLSHTLYLVTISQCPY